MRTTSYISKHIFTATAAKSLLRILPRLMQYAIGEKPMRVIEKEIF